MKTAGVMKRIALAFMVMAMAVAMVACQGAVGKAGTDGTDGTDGQTGDRGPIGLPGISALTQKPNAVLVLPFNNENGDEDAVTQRTISMNDYFAGGNKPEFSATGGGDDVTLKWDDAEIELTITVTREADGGFPADADPIILEAEDLDGRFAKATVTLRDNDPPTGGNADLTAVRIGVQPDKLAASRVQAADWTCPAFNECTASLATVFTDGDTADGDTLSFEAESSDETKLMATVAGDMLTITGLASTATYSDADPPVATNNTSDQAVTVTISATDAGDLSAATKETVMVWVDGVPEAVGSVMHAATYALGENLATATHTILNGTELAALIRDRDAGTEDTFTWNVTSSNDDRATGTATDTDGFRIMVISRGMVTLTLRGTEPDSDAAAEEGVGQYAEHEITFEVVAASS